MSGPSIRHRLEYLAVRAGTALIRLLPERGARALGSGVGWVVGALLGIRSDQVEANLRTAFPDADPGRIRRLRIEAYRHLGRESASTIRLAGTSREHLLARTEVIGLDLLQEALDAGRGAIIVAGHLGNWEVGAAALAARGIPIVAVTRHQRNPLFDDWIRQARADLGFRILPKLDAAQGAGEVLADGGVLALVADQDARDRGIFVDFFGRPASTPPGPAVLALRYRAPMFLAVPIAVADRPGHTRMTLEPITLPEGLSRRGREAATTFTQTFCTRLEAWIRRYPEQYFWQHRRWKTPPPEAG